MFGDGIFDFSPMFEGLDAGLVGVLLVAVLIGVVLGLGLCVFRFLGLYTIAKRRGITNAWLAWLPIGNQWIAGCISDQYRYVAKNQVTNHRTIMLVLAIVTAVLGWINTGADNDLIELIHSVASIAGTVFWVVSMYDLYSSCCPKHSVLYVVLGFVFFFLEPFFIFCNRNKDEGMPQRTNVDPAAMPLE